MIKAVLILLGAAITHLYSNEQPDSPDLTVFSLTELEEHLVEIDSEFEKLANFTLCSGTGSLGYRSRVYDHPNEKEWIRIE